jgi:hypothetical protein
MMVKTEIKTFKESCCNHTNSKIELSWTGYRPTNSGNCPNGIKTPLPHKTFLRIPRIPF